MLPEYGGKLYDLTYRKYPTYEELKIKKCFVNPGPGTLFVREITSFDQSLNP